MFVSGSGFSGSGFLLDFFREQNTLDVLPFRPFNYKSAGLKIGHQVFDLFSEQDSHASRLLALDIVDRLEVSMPKMREHSRHTRPSPGPGKIGNLRRAKRRLSSAFRFRSPNPEIKTVSQPLIEAKHDLAAFRKLASLTPEASFEKRYFMQTWFSSKVRRNINTGDVTMVAIDKSLPQGRERIHALLELACPAKIIFVLRDSYDAIEDEFRSKKRTRSQKLSFEAGLVARLQRKTSFIKTVLDVNAERPNQVGFVSFESLVTDHFRTVQALSNWLDVDFQTSGYRHLNLEISSSNIGIAAELVKRNKPAFDALNRTLSMAEEQILF